MDKKLKYFVYLLLVVVLTIFAFYLNYEKDKESTGFVSFENAIQKEEDGYKVIESKEAGLVMKIPDSWEIIKGSDFIDFYSSDFQKDPLSSIEAVKGCWISIIVDKNETFAGYEFYITKIEELKQGNSDNDFTLFDLSGIDAVEQSVVLPSKNRMSIIRVPYNKAVYAFQSVFSGENVVMCEDYFKDFLNNLVIRQ